MSMAPGGNTAQRTYEVWSPNIAPSEASDATRIAEEDPYDGIYPTNPDIQSADARRQSDQLSMAASSSAGSSTSPPPPRPLPSLLRVTNDPAFSSDPYSNPYFISHRAEKLPMKEKPDKKGFVSPHVTNEGSADRMEDGEPLPLEPPPAYTPSTSSSSMTPSMTSASTSSLTEPSVAVTPSQSQPSVVYEPISFDLTRLSSREPSGSRNASAPELQRPVDRPAYVASSSEPDMRDATRARSDEAQGPSRRASPKRKVHPRALDRIDELDVTNPLGVTLHHGGPYEAINRRLASASHGSPHPRRDVGKEREDPGGSGFEMRGPRHPNLQPTSYSVGEIVPKGFTGQPTAAYMYPPQQHTRPIQRPATLGAPPQPGSYDEHMQNGFQDGRRHPGYRSTPNHPVAQLPDVSGHTPPVPNPQLPRDGRLHKARPSHLQPPPGPQNAHGNPPLPLGMTAHIPNAPISHRPPLQPLPPDRQQLPYPVPSLPNPHPQPPFAHSHVSPRRGPPMPVPTRMPISKPRQPPPPPDISLPPSAPIPGFVQRPSAEIQNRPIPPEMPPRPAPSYLPKRLVMPLPLQSQQETPQGTTSPAPRAAGPIYLDRHRPFQPEKKVQFDAHVRAQEIPMLQKEPKLVKKRNTIGGGVTNVREEPESQPSRGSSWFGRKVARHASVQEEKKESKFPRRLSKRR
ncbi:hypothetical protein GLOTRDRAFT_118726 [Gloeophyllum trabeum ATCC 11539]|uniref:Uncharacterized protein n=1 Tax=Gloeophyllum trabeum (strain ATCC 11539 / FP-39264 / Madison 617) TaxID=670483 RepID=S7S3U7_GLOTA|nr:uncharacterized protein GLOTRDRAFT_118726 [Gloeophyllum trabeum ATCC 11539]EPQ60484.1 hypothetical protein GLOTRDRAFT_118726 [Gloeophyllum trabeum ATCC 11539]